MSGPAPKQEAGADAGVHLTAGSADSLSAEPPGTSGNGPVMAGTAEARAVQPDSAGPSVPIPVLSLDVEEAQIDVLEASRAVLRRDRPLVCAACSGTVHLQRLTAWLAEVGYTYVGSFGAAPTHLFMPADETAKASEPQACQTAPALAGSGHAQHHAALGQCLDALLATRTAQADEVQRLQDQLQALRHELERARRLATRFERAVQVREARLSASARREAMLSKRVEEHRTSASFQIGQALLAGTRSLGGALRLPATLWRIVRDARRRVSAEAEASGAPTPAAQRAPSARALARAFPRASRTDTARLLRQPASLKSLRVAAVMDEFTHHSFAPECELLQLRPGTWQEQVQSFQPDLVFLESAWKGVDGEWAQKISNPSAELGMLIEWAAGARVPTVFWNKEDPAHFGGFLHVARAVDYVFTTDIDCIAHYKREVGHDRVYLLPFAAQPAAHHPIERFPREDAFCFAGSYYLKYPERQRDFRSLLDVVRALGPVEIFDRNFEKPHPHYQFPDEYQPYIVGSLPFEQIDKAYKGYRYGINMNTVKQSQTMFARRVFELLASNTVVVSNFSRGVRLLFGDLVVSSDAATELRRRLEPLRDEATLRKFRLAGLRKVMGEHTYAHRLAYVAEKLGCGGLSARPDRVCAVAFPATGAQATALASAWARQTASDVPLLLVGAAPAGGAIAGVRVVADIAALQRADDYRDAQWVVPISAADYHGPNYVTDLRQATGYAAARALGKAAHHRRVPGGADGLAVVGAEQAYRAVDRLPLRASIVRRDEFDALGVVDADDLDRREIRGDGLVALDEFNYARDTGCEPSAAIRATVDDLPDLRPGIAMSGGLLPLAEAISAAQRQGGGAGAPDAPGLSAEELLSLLPGNLRARLAEGQLRIDLALAEGTHRYAYADRVFTREALNFELNSRFQLQCRIDGTLEVRTVFEFLDADKRKISHAMNHAGAAYSLPIPGDCRFLRFGLRLAGTGTLRIDRLLTDDPRERPSVLVATAPRLVVVKQYPSYDDLYRYGFVHSRLRAYRRHGTACDVFRFDNEEPFLCREFENVDVTSGDRDLLDLALQSGQYQHVLIHLMDRPMWEVVKRHIERVRVTVWVHGAEMQAWQRRAFEFVDMDEEEIERQKKLGEQRVAFWQEVLDAPHPNLTLVFVSHHFAREAAEDLQMDLDAVRHEVIHNFVDGDVFPYVPKQAEDRLKLLSIRPFSGRKYANDLTVEAILALSREPWFQELKISIVGDGEQFEQLTAPLAGLANVTLSRRFLSQPEIADLHRQHGVFLNPTRWDSQGVSRDEAMSSGLVPVTNAVSAVPEFVDANCAMLAPADDPAAIADAIRTLRNDPSAFLAMSQAAAQRVRAQSGFDQTIGRELRLIQHDGLPG